MMTPLRISYLFSGLLHLAVVGTLSWSWQQEIPVLDESRPLTLNLSLHKPVQPAPEPPGLPKTPQPEPQTRLLEASPLPPPTEQKHEVIQPVESRPAPAKKATQSTPADKPGKMAKPPSPQPLKGSKTEKKPARAAAAPSPRPARALATVEKKPPVVSAVDAQLQQHYLAALAAKIYRGKYYPRGSIRRGEEGKVVVSFVIQKNGDLTEISVAKSSGSKRLDAAALKTVRGATPFQPIPDTLNRDHWPISVPIVFNMNG